ncbi:hypothetical protein EJ070_12170 [Mesorhizobium sp. M1E.F.Ca.ET.045.02.1.1]|nr:hypothetical protein EJ070_12170 [Mesorhizobium sp. M1E.F.Ca.ET.045.02.1.1]RUW32141.1 hypothetical protein EOA38_16205 [Mesorhizobium sp. M1E.F.Ca.ET.041.01.1.1]RUW84451.1 hypothetical protein EOA29_09235 [Mesorhizobium sp. M1E.F.Ca.ET.063.01.1.1]RWD91463.1 MAG: hypothetical protein EOS38_05900 [Mesorhizobium sp.]RWD94735.1 MAG: hypothetical protein EOS39_06355 [Mesorhizobium sp.]
MPFLRSSCAAASEGGPDISPTRGEISRANLERWKRGRRRAKLPISPQVGEMSGRTEGGAVECDFSDLQKHP